MSNPNKDILYILREIHEKYISKPLSNLITTKIFRTLFFSFISIVSVVLYCFFLYKIVQFFVFVIAVESLKEVVTWSQLPFFRYEFSSIVIAFCFFMLTVCNSFFRSQKFKNNDGGFLIKDLGGLVLESEYYFETPFGAKQTAFIKEAASELSASMGLKEPKIYILWEQRSINSISCGLGPGIGVIGISWGAIAYLNRNDLRALVCYELSRLKHGETNWNTRVAGSVYGYVFLQILSKKIAGDEKGAFIPIVFSVLLYILGWLGANIGRILQAFFVHKQITTVDERVENFLSDNSWSEVLKKGLGCQQGGRIKSWEIPQARHMFSFDPEWKGLFNCYPELRNRISAIDPNWKGNRIPLMPPADRFVGGKFVKPQADRDW
jgi:Zn-dependent protease with chaperone function